MKIYIKIFIMFIWSNALFAQWTDPSNWSHVGPRNEGSGLYLTGRLDVIALHPMYGVLGNQKIFAGGSGGGLWVTNDDGGHWENIPTNFQKYSGVQDIALTSDGAYLYLCDRNTINSKMRLSSGVYKYNINLQTWSNTGSISIPDLIINHVKIMPNDDNIIFACTNGGLFRSINAGVSWTLVDNTAEYHNVDFMPNGSGFDVYGSGDNIFTVSTNGGATFSSAISTALSTFDNFYADLKCVYVPNSNPALVKKIVYLYGVVNYSDNHNFSANYYNNTALASKAYALNVFTLQNGTVSYSTAPILTYTDNGGDTQIDRLAVWGDKDVVYFTGDGLRKYNFIDNELYCVLNVDNGPRSLGASIIYGFNVYADLHDLKFFDNGTIKRLFVACDGGFGYTNVSYNSTGIYTYAKDNLSVGWEKKNTQLNIAQVHGFSQSETDTNFFATGEQDTRGFIWNKNNMGAAIQGPDVEPMSVLIDNSNHNNIFMSGSLGSSTSYISEDGWSTYLPIYDYKKTDPSLNYFYPNIDLPTGSNYQYTPDGNHFFQDIARPANIYALGSGLMQYSAAAQRFGLKYRTDKFSGNSDPLLKDGYWAIINGLAISPTNKNKLYMSSYSSYWPLDIPNSFPGHVYRYIGPDIDNSWHGHNDNDWDLITPNLRTVTGDASLTNEEIFQVSLGSVIISDWNENKIWVTLSNFPSNKQILTNNFKVLQYENGTWTNYTNGLPADEIAVEMIYERGSNDGIYLATNRAVYYRNRAMTSWQLYDNNIPHLYIKQMLINYSYNKLRAGTYGQGIWETNLKCPDLSSLAINNCINCYPASDFFKEANTISASGSTNSVNTLVLRATDYIEFTPGSSATILGSGTNFYTFAYIHGCSSEGSTFRTPDPRTNDYLETAKASVKIENSFSVYPNPNNGVFTVVFGETSKEKEEYSDATSGHLIVYDIMGKQIYNNQQVGTDKVELDLSDYPKGMYFINYIKNEKVQSKKIIIQ